MAKANGIVFLKCTRPFALLRQFIEIVFADFCLRTASSAAEADRWPRGGGEGGSRRNDTLRHAGRGKMRVGASASSADSVESEGSFFSPSDVL